MDETEQFSISNISRTTWVCLLHKSALERYSRTLHVGESTASLSLSIWCYGWVNLHERDMKFHYYLNITRTNRVSLLFNSALGKVFTWVNEEMISLFDLFVLVCE